MSDKRDPAAERAAAYLKAQEADAAWLAENKDQVTLANQHVFLKLECQTCGTLTHAIDPHAKIYPHTIGTSCKGCGDGWEWTIMNGGSIYAKKKPARSRPGLALMHYWNLEEDLWIVIDTIFLIDQKTGELDMDKEFYYESSTCPTNHLGVHAIIAKGDFDPHGVFLYVRGITYEHACAQFGVTRQQLLDSNNQYLQQLFPEAVHEDGGTFDMDLPEDAGEKARALAYVPPKEKQH